MALRKYFCILAIHQSIGAIYRVNACYFGQKTHLNVSVCDKPQTYQVVVFYILFITLEAQRPYASS